MLTQSDETHAALVAEDAVLVDVLDAVSTVAAGVTLDWLTETGQPSASVQTTLVLAAQLTARQIRSASRTSPPHQRLPVDEVLVAGEQDA